MLAWEAFVALCVLAGVLAAVIEQHRKHSHVQPQERADGWVYFVSPTGQPDAPIKVGMSGKEPCAERLPELRTMSPYPLRILYKFYAEDRRWAERRVHQILKDSRQHGEWFERDATLALIDHLKEGS